MSEAGNLIDLAGVWRLKDEHGEYECDMPIPGDAHSALLAAGLIPDPYVGRNELAVRGLADRDWVASRTFQWEGEGRDCEWFLDFDYLDTVAEIRLNGQWMWAVDNTFRRYQWFISSALIAAKYDRPSLKTGENTIEIVFKSNTRAAIDRAKRQPYKVPYIVQNCPIPNGNMLRKPQCHYGWDWNLAIAPFGLYGRIALRRGARHYDRARSSASVATTQFPLGNPCVDRYSLVCGASKVLDFSKSRSTGRHKYESTCCPRARRKLSSHFEVDTPDLWWPAGHGEQDLYDLTVEVDGQIERRKIGLRTIKLLTDKDPTGPGSRFAFLVNGREIFAKGANWIPADALPSRATPELTEKLLKAAVDANMNMIRVWGGGFYEQDWFYDLCDRLGLMVWQDFMFSCSLYPADDTFLSEVKLEVGYQVRRLSHHACIALWCGDNELIGALTWFEESRKNRDRYLVDYDRLNRTIEEAAKAADHTINWWPSSPSSGPKNFGDAWHDDRSGDMHFWSVWHENKSFDHYRDVKPRFCSEFGFQSYPSLNVIKKFASAEDMNIASPVMDHHQRNAGGNERIAGTMFRYFRFPMAFANFVYLSQIQQGLAMRTAIEYWRSLKPHCMGTLYWQLNDTWPVASWSGLDHGGGWKLMHHMARDFYADVAAFAIPSNDGKTIAIMGVNDGAASASADIAVFTVSVDGKRKDLGTHKMELPSDRAVEIASIDAATIPEDSLLHIATCTPQVTVTRHFAPRPYKSYAFTDPNLQLSNRSTDGLLSVKVAAERPAYFVALECDVPGHFSDAAFDLLPGEPREVTFRPDDPATLAEAARTLIVRDLFSATCR